MTDKIAVCKRTALKMFWDAGVQSEAGMWKASAAIDNLQQPTAGYFMADDVSKLIAKIV